MDNSRRKTNPHTLLLWGQSAVGQSSSEGSRSRVCGVFAIYRYVVQYSSNISVICNLDSVSYNNSNNATAIEVALLLPTLPALPIPDADHSYTRKSARRD